MLSDNGLVTHNKVGPLHTQDQEPVTITLQALSYIGGKVGASPSSLHTALEGPREYANARWM